MIGVGIVGCGGMGSSLVSRLVDVDGAQLVRAYDADPQAAGKLTAKYGGEVSATYAELLDDPRVDAVIVATPGFLHREYVVEAAEASKHVFCEKPMALTVEDCDEMIDACQSAGVNLMVGQVLRLLPVFVESGHIVRERLGRPMAMGIMRIGGWGYDTGWRTRRDTCGGILLEVNVHELDYMRHILGEPEEAFAYGGRYVLDHVDFPDTIFASFRFENGAMGTLKAAVSSRMGRYTGEIICESGTLFYDNSSKTIAYREEGGEQVTLGGDEIPSVDGVATEITEFVESISENRTPNITGEDGRMAVEMALAVERSVQEGRPIPIGEE